MYVCVCVCMYVYAHICARMHACIHTHTHNTWFIHIQATSKVFNCACVCLLHDPRASHARTVTSRRTTCYSCYAQLRQKHVSPAPRCQRYARYWHCSCIRSGEASHMCLYVLLHEGSAWAHCMHACFHLAKVAMEGVEWRIGRGQPLRFREFVVEGVRAHAVQQLNHFECGYRDEREWVGDKRQPELVPPGMRATYVCMCMRVGMFVSCVCMRTSTHVCVDVSHACMHACVKVLWANVYVHADVPYKHVYMYVCIYIIHVSMPWYTPVYLPCQYVNIYVYTYHIPCVYLYTMNMNSGSLTPVQSPCLCMRV
jgi:hypothetical protein